WCWASFRCGRSTVRPKPMARTASPPGTPAGMKPAMPRTVAPAVGALRTAPLGQGLERGIDGFGLNRKKSGCCRVDALKMTVPDAVDQLALYYPTGNEYVALPLINERGALESANVLHLGCKGLIEFCGTQEAPLLAPVVMVNEREVEFPDIAWRRHEHWIPYFTAHAAGLRVTGTICAPPGHRGFVYILEAENLSGASLPIRWGWTGTFGVARQA